MLSSKNEASIRKGDSGLYGKLITLLPMFITAVCLIVCTLVFNQLFIKVLPCFVSLFVLMFSAKANRISFVIGAINCVIYSIGYAMESLWGSVGQVMLVSAPIQIVSFFVWKKWSKNGLTKIRKLNIKGWLLLFVCFSVGWFVFLYIFRLLNDSSLYLDNTLFVLSLCSAFLVIFGYVETKFIDAFSISVSIVLWSLKVSIDIRNITYLIFNIYSFYMSVLGCVIWTRLYIRNKRLNDIV